jgi:predicted DCC family thiol-disulfide oxidoreductase YuxK
MDNVNNMDMIKTKETLTTNKPLVVYDGDCGFCLYWVKYWQKLTGSSVDYRPYQEVAVSYPEISIDQFQHAVQYITPDRKIASGAKASLLTISHGKGSRIWLALYAKLPGFAWMSEQAYQVISTNRSFFYALSVFFWGRKPEPPAYDMIAWLFLRLLGLTFLVAFYSFGTQALGLIGSHGIIPAAEFFNAVYAQIGSQGYRLLPNVFWFNASDFAIQTVCWTGMLASIFLTVNILPRLSLLFLYVLYLSLIYAGQVFMTFQWDILLIETSILAMIFIRYRVLGVWLLRWLTFRFVFAAGVVKITSGDASWWDFTALDYHFLTQPLPTPLAWYAYYLPPMILKTATGASLIIELFIPFLIFFPRRLRFFAAFCILAMQTGIMLTGNYNYFNITTMILCLALFDDAAVKGFFPIRLAAWIRQKSIIKQPYRVTTLLVVMFTMASITLSAVQFKLRFTGTAPKIMLNVNNIISPFMLVNTYGPFAVMTKKRYEIIVEGTNDGVNWKEYKFKFKPGSIFRGPLWNIPFQPRLDWQMWFASLAAPEKSPWFGRLLQKLLENAEDVTLLLESNPFPDYPPVFVRALFFDYTYATEAEYKLTKAWWNRLLVGEYFPPVSLN